MGSLKWSACGGMKVSVVYSGTSVRPSLKATRCGLVALAIWHNPRRVAYVPWVGCRSRKKEETRLGLSRSPPEYHWALEWFLRVLPDVYSRYPSRKVCFYPPLHQDRRASFSPKEICIFLSKAKADDINSIHYARHRFLENLQIGETGSTWQGTMPMRGNGLCSTKKWEGPLSRYLDRFCIS